MTTTATPEILRVNQLRGSHFGPISFQIESGSGALVTSSRMNSLTELIDITCGIDQAIEGAANLHTTKDRTPQPQREKPSHEIGFVSIAADMLSNLRVWENLILPTQVRATRTSTSEIDSLEEQIIEALIAAGFDQSWIETTLPSPPDSLSNFEKVVCGIIRSHLTGFSLLVCENIFGEVDHHHAVRLCSFLNWIGTRHPSSGLLIVHLGATAPTLPGLTAWHPIETLNLDEKS